MQKCKVSISKKVSIKTKNQKDCRWWGRGNSFDIFIKWTSVSRFCLVEVALEKLSRFCPCRDFVCRGFVLSRFCLVEILSVSRFCLCRDFVFVEILYVSRLCPVEILSCREYVCRDFVFFKILSVLIYCLCRDYVLLRFCAVELMSVEVLSYKYHF